MNRIYVTTPFFVRDILYGNEHAPLTTVPLRIEGTTLYVYIAPPNRIPPGRQRTAPRVPVTRSGQGGGCLLLFVGHHIQQIDLQSCLWSAAQGKHEFSPVPIRA